MRRFAVRASSLMWLLGAGASASAGIPTAKDMIWELKQKLFVSQRRVSIASVADLANPAVRRQLQAHIDSLQDLPQPGDPDEYASLFEVVYPAEADRRTYLEAKLAGAKPSYGHLALATLMLANHTRVVWTTNFDALIADACASVFGTTGLLTSVDLDNPHLAKQALTSEQWPIETKLHGDFRSRRLKNTNDELREQDTRIRKELIDACHRFGLVVAGYSGRDDSVMKALEDAAQRPDAFPSGLFWLHRGVDRPLPRVCELLSQCNDRGIESGIVRIENFDEVLRDLIRLIEDVDTTVLDAFAKEQRAWSAAPRPSGRGGWPVIRLNALPLTAVPSVCRRVVCSIGNTGAVQGAIDRAGTNVVAVRSGAGVLAFGDDGEVRATFQQHHIQEFDLHTLEHRRQRYESAERSLLRKAMAQALVRQGHLRAFSRHGEALMFPKSPHEEMWEPLKAIVGEISGSTGDQHRVRWHEGIGVRLEWAQDRLWLLMEPRTVFDSIDDKSRYGAAEFASMRTAERYNRKLNAVMEFWIRWLLEDGGEFSALGVSEGVDAVFRLSSRTAFSRRVVG